MEIGPKFEKDRPWSDEGNGVNLASINVFYVGFQLLPSLVTIPNKLSENAEMDYQQRASL